MSKPVKTHPSRRLALAVSVSALSVAAAVGGWRAPAQAQTASADSPDPLSQVVVTATKQTDTVNRVPLSITAVTQSGLQEQGVKTAQDLARTVPALQISTSNVANGANISIRGVYSTIGAATTAVYLDDVPLQRRTTLGTFSGSGVVFPQLFDLERIEVLRGPQGDLYGGSAEGGAVRFITPAPSLIRYSARARAEVSTTKDGQANYEAGLAVGGPIVADKLAFRASAWFRRDSGYLDHVDAYTGRVIGENTNAEPQAAYRLVLRWAPTDRLTITPALYAARDEHKDSDNFWENVAAVTVPVARYTASGAAYTGSNGALAFTLPAHTYGPYNVFGPYRTGNNCNIGDAFQGVIAPCYRTSPRISGLTVANLSADYEFDFATLHATTAYVGDRNKGANDGSFNETGAYQGGVPFLYSQPLFQGYAIYKNERNGLSDEVRLSSKGGKPLSWVVGVFSSYQRTRAQSHDYTSLKAFAPLLRGVSDTVVFGSPVADNGDVTARDQKLKERELALFGEGSYYATSKLKLIAGGRLAKTAFSYNTVLGGSFFGYAVPTVANGGLSTGAQKASTFLPKVGAQYELSPDDNLYATAAKGFRMGGVNTGPYQFKCASTFSALGITDTPRTYDPDSLWSYEVGAKARTFGGRAQINVSAFYIKWSNVQVNYSLPNPCGFSYTTNAGGAVSKGADIQSQIRLFGGLSASIQAAYTDASYSDALVGPAPTNSIFIHKGDTLPIPAVTANLGLRYDFDLSSHAAYARADYQYAGPYKRGFGPGSSSYNIDTYQAGATDYVSARAGVTISGAELAVFVNNLFNSQDVLTRAGGRACSNADCSVVRSNNPVFADTTFRPRTVGVSVDYRY